MPLDTCITNVGEYYSSHYLDSTFARDVRELVNRWREDGAQAPPRRPAAGERYFRVKTQALDEDAPELRARASEEVAGWHAHLLQALGYTEVHALTCPLKEAPRAPLRGRITRYYRPWLALCETHFCLPDGSLKEGMPSEDPLA